MKTKILYSFFLLLMFVAFSVKAQQNGIAWFSSIASKGVDSSPGFAVDTAGQVFVAVNFSSPLVIETGGSIDTLDPGLQGEAIVAQISIDNGSIIRYFHLGSPGHIAITSIGFHLHRLVVSGSSHDSVWLKAHNTDAVFIGGGAGLHTGFQLFCGPNGESPVFTQPVTAALRAGFERICSFDSLLVTSGKYLPDSVTERMVMIAMGDGSERLLLLPETTKKMEVNDLCYVFGHLFIGGSFHDSLNLSNGSLYALAGKDAFLAIADSFDSTYLHIPIAWHGLQDAKVSSMAAFDASLWVAVNFADTLFVAADYALNGRNGTEAALFRYDSLLNLQSSFHLKGNGSERIEKLFVSDNKLYVLANIDSDSCELMYNNSSQLLLGHPYGTGAHTLLSIDTSNQATLDWMAKEGHLGKLTGVHKVSPTETLLSGLYGNPLIIDSVQFEPFGIQDVYLLRIDDLCLSRLKSGKETFRFCDGDSIQVSYALPVSDNVLLPTGKSTDHFYIKRPGRYSIPYESECGCLETDSLAFDWYWPQPGENPLETLKDKTYNYMLADGGLIELRYFGQCMKLNDPKQPQFSLQPNPVLGTSFLKVSLTEEGELQMEISDGRGAVLYKEQKILSIGQQQLELPAQYLQPGNYFLRLQFDTGLKKSYAVLKLTKL